MKPFSVQKHTVPSLRIVWTMMFAVAAVLSGRVARAQNSEWAVGVGLWREDANWTPVGMPGQSGTAIIANGGTAVFDDGDHWEVSRLFLGDSPASSGAVLVKEGGRFQPDFAYIGHKSGTGTVTVDGDWGYINWIEIGSSGPGTLTISDTGKAGSSDAFIGFEAGSTGEAVVSGSWDAADISVGREGSGSLVVKNGGMISNQFLHVGEKASGSGQFIIEGSGFVEGRNAWIGTEALSSGTAVISGSWSNEEALSVGVSGTGLLQVLKGGRVSTRSAFVGVMKDGAGLVTVRDGGKLTVSEDLTVGEEGKGRLDIQSGADVIASTLYMGVGRKSAGEVNVRGNLRSDDLIVGYSGTGTLDIKKGGKVVSDNAYLGLLSRGFGNATVRGSWDVSRCFVVGSEGEGTLSIVDGGWVDAREADVILGQEMGGRGAVTVKEGRLNTGELRVGNAGGGILTLKTTGTVFSRIGYVGGEAGARGRVDVEGRWEIDQDLYIGLRGEGSLNIASGGRLNDRYATIGFAKGSVGTVGVAGRWKSEELLVGYQGRGRFTVFGEGYAQTRDSSIGFGAGSSGVATVASGTWNNTGEMNIGAFGEGSLKIGVDGVVNGREAQIGAEAGSSGVAEVKGEWTLKADLLIGNWGAGRLDIARGGVVENRHALIGMGDGSDGAVTVAGRWTNREDLVVGNEGAGLLDIEKRGSVSSSYGKLGALAGSNGMVAIAGEWEVTNNLVVGDEGEGTLTIKTGGHLGNRHAYIGMSEGGTGEVFVDGAWKNQGDLVVGFEGKGTLVVEKEGTLSDINSLLGAAEGASGTAFVGGSWKNAGDLVVGNSGEAELSIVKGGRVESARGFIGLDQTGRGMAFVDGQWRNTEDLVVGFGGGGLLSVGKRGSVSSANAQIGYMENSKGVAFVQGKWMNAGALIIGDQGEGELVVTDGGRVENTDAYLGFDKKGEGAAFIEKGRWESKGNLTIGNSGGGALIVDVEGYAKARNIILGRSNGSWGFASVSGTLESGGGLAVGQGGSGTFIVLEGGRVSVGGGVTLDEGKTESSIMLSGEEGQRGSLATSGIIASSRRARLVFDGGIVRATRDQNDFLSGFAPGKIEFGAGGGFIDSGKNRIGIHSVIKGSGGLVKQGPGTLLLSGSNRFKGNSFLREGTVRTENTRALGLGSVTLESGATLDVNGRLRLSDFTWEGGGLVALTSPSDDRRRASSSAPTGSADASLALSGAFVKGKGDGKFVFKLSGFDSPNTTYNLLKFSESRGFKASDFSSNGFYGLKTTFDLKSGRLLLSYEGVSSGPYLQNTAYIYTPRDAHFVVDGPVQTGKTEENNHVQSLFFKTDSSLSVRNTLTVSSGRLIAISGTSTLKGDSIVTPDHFTKLGDGLLIVDAALTAGGAGKIAEGGVQLHGEIRTGSGLVIGNGSFLSGDGRVKGDLDVQGTLSPGLGIGKIHIEGDYTTTANGLLLVEVAGRREYDSVAVEGTAELGGKIALAARGGFQFDYGQRFTVVEADKVTGKYREILVPDGFRSRLLVDETTASVLLAPESYTRFARTPNDEAIATALDSFITAEGGDREVVSIALDSLAADEYANAFQQIAPNFYETLVNMTFEQNNAQGQMLQQRFSALRLGVRGFSQSGLNVPVVTENAGKSHRRQDLKEAKNIMESSLENPWGVWVQGNGLFASESSLANLPNYRYDSGGLLLGVDYRWSPWLSTGIYISYQNTHARYDGGGSARISGVRFGTYATFDAGNGFYANGLLGGGGSAFKVRRPIQFGSIDRVARSTPSGGDFTAMLGGGYDFTAGIFTVGPIASAQYTHTRIGVVSEHGADSLNLRLEEQSANSLLSTLGVRVGTTWKLSPSLAIIPEGRVTWQHEFLRDARDLTGSLDGGSGPGFTTRTAAIPRDSVFAGAGLNFQFDRDWSANLYYNADFGGGSFKSQMVSGGVNIQF